MGETKQNGSNKSRANNENKFFEIDTKVIEYLNDSVWSFLLHQRIDNMKDIARVLQSTQNAYIEEETP